MHEYTCMSILAIDSGVVDPFITMQLRRGAQGETACRAEKTFSMEEVGEVRSIIGWASLAFLQAADELSQDGWTIHHHPLCDDGKDMDLDA